MRTSYTEDDVILLLKDITGLVEPQPTEERERLIQAGRHYCEMLPVEYVQSEAYMEAYRDALKNYSVPTAAAVGVLADQVMRRKEDKVDRVRSSFGTIKREPVSLEMKIGSVMEYARKYRKFSFRQILETGADRLDVVVTFLAVLELMKLGKIYLLQERSFEDMQIETLEEEGAQKELNLEGLEDSYGE